MKLPHLPGATSFAEGQRALFGWLMAAGGVFYGLAALAVVLLLWRGGWSVASEAQRITAIGVVASGFIAGSIATTIALAIGGPVGRFKASLNKDGASFDAEGKAADAANAVANAAEAKANEITGDK